MPLLRRRDLEPGPDRAAPDAPASNGDPAAPAPRPTPGRRSSAYRAGRDRPPPPRRRPRPAAAAACSSAGDAVGVERRLEARAAQDADAQPGDAVLDAVAPVPRLVGQADTGRAGRTAPSPRASAPRRAPCASSARRRRRDANAPGGHCGTRPKLGFSPTRPHHAAGMRIEPPASVPTCSGPNPAAAAAPGAGRTSRPACGAGFHGLRVMPCSGQSPGDFQPNSVVVVLPTITAPSRLQAEHQRRVLRLRRRPRSCGCRGASGSRRHRPGP